MMIIRIIEIMLYCSIATYFFALLMKTPKRAIFVQSLTGTLGYLAFLVCASMGSEILGFFIGTLLIALSGEYFARKITMPASVFIFPAVIPMVPGLGLYQTMLSFIQGDIPLALETGVTTLTSIGAMAIALTAASLITLFLHRLKTGPKDESSTYILAEETDEDMLIELLKLVSQVTLESGAETYRAEEICKYIARSHGASEIDSFALPTGIYFTVSFDGKKERTIVKRIKKRSINLEHIDLVNTLSREVSKGSMKVKEAISVLNSMHDNLNSNKSEFALLYGGISAAFFTLLFGGEFGEFAIALGSGIIVTYLTKDLYKLDSYQFLVAFVGGVVISASAILGSALVDTINYQNIIVGGMMPLFPGLAMTNAIRDTIRGDLVSGIARGTEALLVATSLAIGAGVTIYLSNLLGIFVF